MNVTRMPRPNRQGRRITPIRTTVRTRGVSPLDLAATAARTVVFPLAVGASFLRGLTSRPRTEARDRT